VNEKISEVKDERKESWGGIGCNKKSRHLPGLFY